MEEAALLSEHDMAAEALAVADKALALDKRRELVLRAGDLNRIADRMDVARKLYDEVVANDAARGLSDWRVLFARATVRSEKDDWPGAEADLQAALALEPDRPELLNYLGYGWINQGVRVQEGLAGRSQIADLLLAVAVAAASEEHRIDPQDCSGPSGCPA